MKLTKIYWSKPVYKIEFEHKPSIHVITLCAASVVAHASLRCTMSLTISLFQFCAQWINEHIVIAIILNENDSIFRMAFSNIASILTFSCSGLNGGMLCQSLHPGHDGRR